MFLVASISMLRERRSGILERLMALPTSKFGLLVGYAVAFGVLAIVQSVVALSVAVLALELAITVAMGLVALAAGSLTLGRRTP